MQTFLMRAGIDERDYAEEIPQWKKLCAAVQADARAEEQEAAALLLGDSSSSSSATAKSDPIDAAKTKAKQCVAEWIGRARKAYGYLYAALPADLRQLVADVPQGYAFGVWSFLEKKFRNTEQDSVMALWKQFATLAQEPEENFDAYKARVDSVHELLTHAKQPPPAGLYVTLLLWNLQPRYATAVLTLKTGDRLKDAAAMDWPYIVQYMAQYERTQLHTDSSGGGSDGHRAMPAFGGRPQAGQAAVQDITKVDCYYCKKLGHYASDCPAVKAKEKRMKEKERRQKDKRFSAKKAKERSRSSSPSSDSEKSESEGEGETRRSSSKASANRKVNAVRVLNRFAALSDDDEAEDDWPQPASSKRTAGRVHLARVLLGRQVAGAWKGTPAPRSILTSMPDSGIESKRAKTAEKTTTKKSVSFSKRPMKKELPAASKARKAVDTLGAALRKAGLLDTGAMMNTTGNRDTLINLRRCAPFPIQMADRSIVTAVYKGDMPMCLEVAGGSEQRTIEVVIEDVYYHERIEANLLCWDRMRRDGWELHSSKEGTYVITPAGVRVNASTRAGLTLLMDVGPNQVYAMRMGRIVCATAEDLMLLHQRIGHPSWGKLLDMCKAGTTIGIGDISAMSTVELTKAERCIKTCTACAQGKQRRNSLGHRGLDRGTESGEVLHMDTFHVTVQDRHTGEKRREYGLLATDGCNGQRWFTPSIRYKDVQQEVVAIVRSSRTLTGRYPRLIVSDLGKEFDNRIVDEYCSKHGIQHQPTPRGAKELNGIAENSVGTVKNHTRTMLLAAGVPDHIGWMRAAAHHVYLWNRTHVNANTGVTPYEAATKREPSILNVGVFGCDAFVHQDRSQRSVTFSPKAEPGIYLGHDAQQNCAVVRMLHTGKTIRAKDVIFREGSFTHMRAECDRRADEVETLDLAELEMEPSASATHATPEAPRDALPERRADLEVTDTDSDNDDEEPTQADDKKYTVKSITSHRTGSHGATEYQVKWVGHSALTWEPEAAIREDAPKVVKDYEQFLERRSNARVTRSRTTQASGTSQPAPALLKPASTPSSVADNSSSDCSEDENESDSTLAARDVAAQRL